MRILLINGPNLNTLGTREPDVYGVTTLPEIEARVRERAASLKVDIAAFQSNGEGAIIDFIQAEAPNAAGIIINPGALTHYSFALRDALAASGLPAVEVHISNIYGREHFRRRSVTAACCLGIVAGLGWRGYVAAVESLVAVIGERSSNRGLRMSMPTADRIAKLRSNLQERGLDALLVSQPANRRYLSGFTGSSGYLLISESHTLIATDFRYFEQAAAQSPDFRLQPVAGSAFETWLPALLTGLGGKKVGFEAAHLPYATFEQMAAVVRALPEGDRPRLVPTTDIVESLRAIKEPDEIDAIQAAVDLGDAAFAHLMQHVEPDWTEKQAAWEIEKYMREHGGEAVSFETIVAAGPWSAMPHAYPRDEPLGESRPIVVDMGVRLDGYCSDLTRTIVLGKPDGEFRRIYDIVLGAQLTAIELIEAGMTGEQAHLLAERFIAEAGYGDKFGHGLGHGVGLEVHEKPRLGRSSEDVLADGMVTSVEPGIYISGWGGVRIEDLAAMENGRLRVLSRAPKIGPAKA